MCAAVGVGHDFNAHELLFVGVEVVNSCRLGSVWSHACGRCRSRIRGWSSERIVILYVVRSVGFGVLGVLGVLVFKVSWCFGCCLVCGRRTFGVPALARHVTAVVRTQRIIDWAARRPQKCPGQK